MKSRDFVQEYQQRSQELIDARREEFDAQCRWDAFRDVVVGPQMPCFARQVVRRIDEGGGGTTWKLVRSLGFGCFFDEELRIFYVRQRIIDGVLYVSCSQNKRGMLPEHCCEDILRSLTLTIDSFTPTDQITLLSTGVYVVEYDLGDTGEGRWHIVEASTPTEACSLFMAEVRAHTEISRVHPMRNFRLHCAVGSPRRLKIMYEPAYSLSSPGHLTHSLADYRLVLEEDAV